MSVFKLEEEIWEIDGIRVFIIDKNELPENYLSYKETFPIALKPDDSKEEFIDRVITCTGHGVSFGVIYPGDKTIEVYNYHKPTLQNLH